MARLYHDESEEELPDLASLLITSTQTPHLDSTSTNKHEFCRNSTPDQSVEIPSSPSCSELDGLKEVTRIESRAILTSGDDKSLHTSLRKSPQRRPKDRRSTSSSEELFSERLDLLSPVKESVKHRESEPRSSPSSSSSTPASSPIYRGRRKKSSQSKPHLSGSTSPAVSPSQSPLPPKKTPLRTAKRPFNYREPTVPFSPSSPDLSSGDESIGSLADFIVDTDEEEEDCCDDLPESEFEVEEERLRPTVRLVNRKGRRFAREFGVMDGFGEYDPGELPRQMFTHGGGSWDSHTESKSWEPYDRPPVVIENSWLGEEPEMLNSLQEEDFSLLLSDLDNNANEDMTAKLIPVVESGPAAEEKARKEFQKKKHQMAKDLLKQLDDKLTGGRIQQYAAAQGGVEIVWTKKLMKTAGRAGTHRRIPQSSTSSKRDGPQWEMYFRIDLAEKIVDNEDRLNNVLAHEFCHLATQAISGVMHPPHGREFKEWAKLCSVAFSHLDVVIETYHSYVIDYKYRWECTSCGASFQRHSKSIDVTKKVCNRCRSRLVQTKPAPVARQPSGYQLFVKENFQLLKEASPYKSNAEIMSMLGTAYREDRAEQEVNEIVREANRLLRADGVQYQNSETSKTPFSTTSANSDAGLSEASFDSLAVENISEEGDNV